MELVSVKSLNSKLADFINSDSWYFFNLLTIDCTFLSLDVDDWSQNEAYSDGKSKARALNVVNDCSERRVALGYAFLGAARIEEHYQNTLQVAEKNRKDLTYLRKWN